MFCNFLLANNISYTIYRYIHYVATYDISILDISNVKHYDLCFYIP